ncbi:MAG: hypothetical protein Q8P11_03095 [bacterium]|nr:hypothetical protein [bacterium]
MAHQEEIRTPLNEEDKDIIGGDTEDEDDIDYSSLYEDEEVESNRVEDADVGVKNGGIDEGGAGGVNNGWWDATLTTVGGLYKDVNEKLEKIPLADAVVGRLKMIYDNVWIDHHKEKSSRVKDTMDTFDLELRVMDKEKTLTESIIKKMKEKNIPGVGKLTFQLEALEKKIQKKSNAKEKTQSNIEKRSNKVEVYTKKRDTIADRFINRYDEKIRPMEDRMKGLETSRKHVDLLVSVMEARHAEKIESLESDKKEKQEYEKELYELGWSERKIKSNALIKNYEKTLSDAYEEMRAEREQLHKRKMDIDIRIAKIDNKANPYRDRREKFIHVKDGRPIDWNLKKRTKSENNIGTDTIHPRIRETAPSGQGSRSETAGVSDQNDREENDIESNPEVKKKKMSVGEYIATWNKHIENEKGAPTEAIIRPDSLYKTSGLRKDETMGTEFFGKILVNYYIFKDLQVPKFNLYFNEYKKKLEKETKKQEKGTTSEPTGQENQTDTSSDNSPEGEDNGPEVIPPQDKIEVSR